MRTFSDFLIEFGGLGTINSSSSNSNTSNTVLAGGAGGAQAQAVASYGLVAGGDYEGFAVGAYNKNAKITKAQEIQKLLQKLKAKDYMSLNYYDQNILDVASRQPEFDDAMKNDPSGVGTVYQQKSSFVGDETETSNTSPTMGLAMGLGNWWGKNPDEWHWRKGGLSVLVTADKKAKPKTPRQTSKATQSFTAKENIGFSELHHKLKEDIANSASFAALGIEIDSSADDTTNPGASPGKSGKGSGKGRMGQVSHSTTSDTNDTKKGKDDDDTEEMWYVKYNKKQTKEIMKLTKTRVKTHNKFK